LLAKAYWPIEHIGPLFEMEGSIWKLPLTLPRIDGRRNEDGTITLTTYRQVYGFIDREKDSALKNFQLLYGEIEP
jgi:hypothetical protein